MLTKTKPEKNKLLFSPGHRGCAGCGQAVAAKTVIAALGPNTIIANATGCLEVTTTPYPESAWGVSWIHSLFENAAAVASGIRAALDHKIKSPLLAKERDGVRSVKVVAQGGDGSTFDIGIGLISGMWERQENILYVCYDTEAYSNTGIQASGATPWGANTTTTPAGTADNINGIGSHLRQKDMIAIALAHRVPYIAQTTTGYLADITAKVKKALQIQGPSYIQIMSPCIPGWGVKTDSSVSLGKLAAQTGFYPLLEFVNGQLVNKLKVPQPTPKVEEFLKLQSRFAHLFKSELGLKQIEILQKQADENIAKYGLGG